MHGAYWSNDLKDYADYPELFDGTPDLTLNGRYPPSNRPGNFGGPCTYLNDDAEAHFFGDGPGSPSRQYMLVLCKENPRLPPMLSTFTQASVRDDLLPQNHVSWAPTLPWNHMYQLYDHAWLMIHEITHLLTDNGMKDPKESPPFVPQLPPHFPLFTGLTEPRTDMVDEIAPSLSPNAPLSRNPPTNWNNLVWPHKLNAAGTPQPAYTPDDALMLGLANPAIVLTNVNNMMWILLACYYQQWDWSEGSAYAPGYLQQMVAQGG